MIIFIKSRVCLIVVSHSLSYESEYWRDRKTGQDRIGQHGGKEETRATENRI